MSDPFQDYIDRLEPAAREYLSLRDRAANPKGSFSGGRWYPDTELPCCQIVRRPSRQWPYTLLKHCRTATHVGYAWDIDPSHILIIAHRLESGGDVTEAASRLAAQWMMRPLIIAAERK